VKVTNISQGTLHLRDLKFTPASQTEGRRGEERYLGAGHSVYLPNTSEVLRSVLSGDIKAFLAAGKLKLEDSQLINNGASVVLNHGFGFPPSVYVLKKVSSNWVDATGTVDIVHNETFTQTSITNVSGAALTFYIRLLT